MEREGVETDRQTERDIGGENYKDGRVEFRERIMKISPEGRERERGWRERERRWGERDRQTETERYRRKER